MDQQQQPIPPQQPYPTAQPMMMDKPQQIPVQYTTQPGVQFVPIQQQGMSLPVVQTDVNKLILALIGLSRY